MDRQLYDPALIERGEDGQFWHPDLPFPEGAESARDDVDISGALTAQGYTWTVVEPNHDFPDDDGAGAYWQALREWQPEQPEGEGWLLACIADTDDGPRAWFVRPIT